MITIEHIPGICREYYESPAKELIKKYGLNCSTSQLHEYLIGKHKIQLICQCDGGNEVIEVTPPTKTRIRGEKGSTGSILNALGTFLSDSEKHCPTCKSRLLEKQTRATEREEQQQLDKRIDELQKIRSELKSEGAYFWYYKFINKYINESRRSYEDKGYFTREILPIACEVPPYKFAAIVSYVFYKADIVVSESPYPRSFSITVKSFLKRFLAMYETWNINDRYLPENLATGFLIDYPELSDIDDIILDSLNNSHHQHLVVNSKNVIKLF